MANARTTYGKVAAPRIRKIDIALARRPDLFPYLMVVMVLLTLVSIFHVWSRVKVIDMNLQIAEMSRVITEQEQEQNRLKLEVASLKTPGRIEALAKGELGMAIPTEQQVVTAARAFYLQVVEKELLVKLAERQHQKTVALTPGRGTIYDRTNAPLAVSIEMDSCYAEPRNIENIADTVAKLAPLVGMPREELTRKLTGSKGFVWLVRRISPDQARKIRELEIDGIGFVKETKRFYPNAEMAGSVIGFTGLDPEGLEGIELKYDSTILGSSGFLVTERDALGRDIAMKGTLVKEASKGHNVTLTLDKNIQYIAEKELAAAVESSRAKGGIALVMEPQTGRVLAMANYPSFNPNSYFKYPQALLRNKCISDSFEPGSTFKVFLIAAALEEKVVTPGDGFNCEGGSYSIGGRTIHD